MGGDERSKSSQLFSWCRHKKTTELAGALAAGADPDTQDGAGNSLLTIACQNGNLALVKLLLSRGASPNTPNIRGNTPLHYCFNYGYDSIGAYLIEQGADEFQTNLDGLTCYEGLTHSDLDLL
mmetsp:Transcript_32578/g.71710  ORF Transcript_32578/g.71710 Transcript_32578/m.71710 type:complete len:123 (+) Transcript_32578:3-371(+)